MFVAPEHRGRGYSREILKSLEQMAIELSLYTRDANGRPQQPDPSRLPAAAVRGSPRAMLLPAAFMEKPAACAVARCRGGGAGRGVSVGCGGSAVAAKGAALKWRGMDTAALGMRPISCGMDTAPFGMHPISRGMHPISFGMAVLAGGIHPLPFGIQHLTPDSSFS